MARARKNKVFVPEAAFEAIDKTVEDKKISDRLSRVQALYAAGGILDATSTMLGAMTSASAIRAKGKYEEAAFAENARRLKRAAKRARETGQKDAAEFMRGIRKLESAQKVAQAASGIEISGGTAEDVRAETLEYGLEDASTIRMNAYLEAFGYEQQAVEQEANAKLNRIARKHEERSSLLSGKIKTMQTIIGAGLNIYGAKSGGKQNG